MGRGGTGTPCSVCGDAMGFRVGDQGIKRLPRATLRAAVDPRRASCSGMSHRGIAAPFLAPLLLSVIPGSAHAQVFIASRPQPELQFSGSKKGIATPPKDIELIRQRLAAA